MYNPEDEACPTSSAAFKKFLTAAREEIEPYHIFAAIANGDIEYDDQMNGIITRLIEGKAFEQADRLAFSCLFEDLIDKFVEAKALALEDAQIQSMANADDPDFYFY
jgi:hypothetical protein